MELQRKIGTRLICGIMVLGFVMTLATAFSTVLQIKGISNPTTEWFTQNVSIDLKWWNQLREKYHKYYKKKTVIEKYRDAVLGAEATIEGLCTGSLPPGDTYKTVADTYRMRILHANLSARENEWLSVEKDVKCIEDFASYLEDAGIGFVYVNLPAYERIDVETRNVETERKLTLYDSFSQKMENSGVPYLDISHCDELVSGFSLDYSKHWYPADALKVTKAIAKELNEKYGYRFDEKLFDGENYSNILDDYPEIKSSIKANKGYEYDLPVPVRRVEYDFNYNDTEMKNGDFAETQLRASGEWKADGGAYHEMWTISNGVLAEMKNLSHKNNEGKKLLILGDSFSWPIVSYISQDIGETAYLHPRYFYGYAKSYIDSFQPDIVLMIYTETQVDLENAQAFSVLE